MSLIPAILTDDALIAEMDMLLNDDKNLHLWCWDKAVFYYSGIEKEF